MKTFLLLILSLLATRGFSQDTINQCKFIHLQIKGISADDSIKVKSGYWIEKDTSIVEGGQIVIQKYSPIKLTQQLRVCTLKGRYNANNKIGLWQYFDEKNKLWKEVYYDGGTGNPYRFTIYYPDGTLHFFGDSFDNYFDFEERNTKGIIIHKGVIPAWFINVQSAAFGEFISIK